MSGRRRHRHFDGDKTLLCHLDWIEAALAYKEREGPGFIEYKSCADQCWMILDQMTGAEFGTCLFIRNRSQNQVALADHATTLERQHQHQVHGTFGLHVDSATPPNTSVRQFCGEWSPRPSRGLDRHDIGMRREHQRGF